MSQPQEDERLSPETVDVLIALKNTDQSIAALERELARQPSKLDGPRRTLATSKAAAADAAEIVVAAQKRIDAKTVESDAIQADVKKLEGQLFSLKTTTEFDAMKSQIKSKQELDDRLQTEVLELMEGVSDLKEAREREAKALEDAEDEFKRVERSIAEETAALEKQLAEARDQRGALEGDLPESVRAVHTAVCERRGSGVAEIVEEVCRGCDTRVTMQTLNAVMGHRLVQCPHCDRILYVAR